MQPPAAGRCLPALIVCGALALAGCATTGERTESDPIEGFNRGVYKFNDALDRGVLKPTAKAYVKWTPDWFRTGVGNFFMNLKGPGTIVNQLLQGKFREAGQDTARLLLNTTFGLVPIYGADVALHAVIAAVSAYFGFAVRASDPVRS